MFSGRYTTVSNVIETIYRNYGIMIPKGDVMEFIWEAIGVMGRPEILVPGVKDVVVTDYTGYLPPEQYMLLGCREKSTGIVLKPYVGTYPLESTLSSPTSTVAETTFLGTYENGVFEKEVKEAFISLNVDISAYTKWSDDDRYKYSVKNGVIRIGIQNTTLEVAYLGFPVWEDDTPMVPEDPRVFRGIVDYITEKVAFRMMLSDKLSERKWGYIKENALWSMGSATNYLKLPTVEVMEGIKNRTIRIMPRNAMWENGFKNLND